MPKRIIYTGDDNRAIILIPSPNTRFTIEELAEKDVPKGSAYYIVDTVDVPSDRYFRNAWELSGEKIAVNMTKALEIQKEKIRIEREPLLQALDAEYMKALESKDTQKEADIIAQKQALRDATSSPLLTAARTPEELKQVSLSVILAGT